MKAGFTPAVVGLRQRCAGAGRRAALRSTDRLVATLVHLRLGVPHEALAVAFGVDRSTVTRAVGQVRPLLAGRGCAVASGVRLRTLADVFAYAAAEDVTLRMDATEIRVRRPRRDRGGRSAFVSGKAKQNTIKITVIRDERGSPLCCGAHRPGRVHDATAVRVEGIDMFLRHYPTVVLLVDAAYQGLAKPFVIGATQFAEKFGQGFYGWIGDVRITGKALQTREFLTAR